MRRKGMSIKLGVLTMVMILSQKAMGASGATWQKAGRGIYESGITAVAVDPRVSSLIFAATAKAIYRSTDNGNSYQAVLQVSGVHDMYADPPYVFAATDEGLYQSSDTGRNWRRIYFSSDEGAKACRSVIHRDGIFYLGTAKGLFTRSRDENNWRRVEGELGQAPVEHLKEHNGAMYIATDRAVFRQDRKGGYRQIFTVGIGPGLEEDGDPAQGSSPVRGSIFFLEASGSYIFVGTPTGIHVSADEGRQWRRVASDHVPLEDLTALLVMNNGQSGLEGLDLLAGSKKGAFLFKDGGWRPIYEGMETNRISRLAKDAHNTVYAATDRGMFHLALNGAPSSFSKTQERMSTPAQIKQVGDLDAQFGGEPGISEVHQLAIDYAEVSPQKITEWRRLAKRRAWLPDLDIGVDSARDWSRSSSIWGTYTSGGQHYVGPEDKTRGGDLGWDIALSWNLGDLIYSSEQTTIDSRSKLMVELREDILDQVTRLYFERRRVQAELAAADTLEPLIKIDKEMRVAELTALLDAFTGGQFSRRIHK